MNLVKKDLLDTVEGVRKQGIEPIDDFIRSHLPSHTAAFAGASGIGKSTLLNRLFPDLSLSTSDISKKIQRKRFHATITYFKIETIFIENPI